MHSNQRFLHSISARVDDNPSPGLETTHPTVVGSVDTFGDPNANQGQIGSANLAPGQVVTICGINSALGQLINADVLVATTVPIVPSHLQGRVQAQLFPPTVSVPDASGTKLTVTIGMISRYFPDANTAPLAEFVRGELHITAAVNQFTSQTANVLEIDFKADQASVNFVPTSSSHPLTQQDKAGINLAIHNALKTSFLPSNITLPAGITFVQLKTLSGPTSGIAILLNTQGGPGNPASMTGNFLGTQDQFAFAISPSFIARLFGPVIDSIVSQPPQTITIPIDLFLTTVHVVYSIALNSADFTLLDGKIVLTVHGHAKELSHKWYAPDDFDFTATFGFTLRADGSTADLVPGDVSLDTSSFLVNRFKSSATSGITQARDQALQQSGAFAAVRNTLDANKNLGGFLSSLLRPSGSKLFSPGEEAVLAYSAVDIRSTGIVLHGSLSVVNIQPVFTRGASGTSGGGSSPGADWPAPYVEFEQIPASSRGPIAPSIQGGPNYSALKSWIPGGTIDWYEWKVQGDSALDANRFVYIPPPLVLETSDGTPVATAVSAFAPVCLTVRGSRISSSGAVVSQSVVASVCSYTLVTLIPAELAAGIKGVLPTVTLAQSGADGRIVVAGHTPVSAGTPGSRTPNLLVHFPDQKGVQDLQLLALALRDSKRPLLSTAIIAVLDPGLIADARHTRGIVYAEDHNGDWERLFGINNARRPLTLIVDANGKIAWQHEGHLDRNGLADALRKYLASPGSVSVSLIRSHARVLQPAPNFIFDYAPGRQLALRKLTGKPTILVFWRTSSQASIDAVRDAEEYSERGNAATVLAINDGESTELASKAATENKLTATLVTDPKRDISIAYGVNLWPTVVELDAFGLVTGIRHGRDAEHHAEPSSQSSVEQRS